MTARLMLRLSPSSLLRGPRFPSITSASKSTQVVLRTTFFSPCRSLAQVQSRLEILPEIWFTSSSPRRVPEGLENDNSKPPDERTIKLGKTLRILQEHLPTLLATPLPQEILSPNITLHLFPSTHPHLPTVSGRVAYRAALWTAPMAWGRVPIVGNVRLIIQSERMVKNGDVSAAAGGNEKLIVRWKTCGKTKGKGMGALYRGIGASEQVDKITEWLGGDARDDEEFCGLFMFEFDEEGRIVTHTIEHADEGGSWDKMAKVVSVTDWLLGKAKRRKKEDVPELALGYCGPEGRDVQRRNRGRRSM